MHYVIVNISCFLIFSKGIYGSASKKDLLELKEEGIDAQMLPWVEDKEN